MHETRDAVRADVRQLIAELEQLPQNIGTQPKSVAEATSRALGVLTGLTTWTETDELLALADMRTLRQRLEVWPRQPDVVAAQRLAEAIEQTLNIGPPKSLKPSPGTGPGIRSGGRSVAR